jgi:hypothetical protein
MMRFTRLARPSSARSAIARNTRSYVVASQTQRAQEAQVSGWDDLLPCGNSGRGTSGEELERKYRGWWLVADQASQNFGQGKNYPVIDHE